MKHFVTFLGAFSLLVGCGSSSDTDGGTDGSSGSDGNVTDTGVKTDGSGGDSAGNDSGDMDSGMQNEGGPMDAGIECMNPTTCMGGNMYCCATVTSGMGTPPNCFFNGSYSTKCTMTCNSNFNPQCNTMSTRRLCNMKSQCTEMAYNQCCTVMLNGQNVSLCMSAQEAQIAQAQCL